MNQVLKLLVFLGLLLKELGVASSDTHANICFIECHPWESELDINLDHIFKNVESSIASIVYYIPLGTLESVKNFFAS